MSRGEERSLLQFYKLLLVREESIRAESRHRSQISFRADLTKMTIWMRMTVGSICMPMYRCQNVDDSEYVDEETA